MKRLHVHVAVDDPAASERFYRVLFGAPPNVLKDRYAARPVLEEGATTCCYARSEKSWISDPQGISWEAFLTSGESEIYGRDPGLDLIETSTCCTPEAPQGRCCPPKPELAAGAPCCGASAAAR